MLLNIFFKKEQIINNFWTSIADLMIGLMVIFLFISITYMYEIQKLINNYEMAKGSLYKMLDEEFKRTDIYKQISIDKTKLSISMPEDTLFNKGETTFKDNEKAIVFLNVFLPTYFKVINQYKEIIREIRIEGHTSSDWDLKYIMCNCKKCEFCHIFYSKDLQPEIKRYLLNMALSQKRTRIILQFLLENYNKYEIYENEDNSKKNQDINWICKNIFAIGLSSSQIKINKYTGKEDRDKSRRVEFRIITNTEESIIMRILNWIRQDKKLNFKK